MLVMTWTATDDSVTKLITDLNIEQLSVVAQDWNIPFITDLFVINSSNECSETKNGVDTFLFVW